MIDSSWVIISKETGKAVMETYDFELLQFINIEKYEVKTILDYLFGLNKGA